MFILRRLALTDGTDGAMMSSMIISMMIRMMILTLLPLDQFTSVVSCFFQLIVRSLSIQTYYCSLG